MRIESPVSRLWHVCLYVVANWGIAAANDVGLEERISFPGNPVETARVLNHNRPEALAQEINDLGIRTELAKAAHFPDIQQLQDIKLIVISEAWPEGPEPDNVVTAAGYTLRYPSRQAKTQFSARFRSILGKYLQLRLVGHTRKFALASLATTPNASLMDADAASLLTQYPGLPHSWIKRREQNGEFLGFYLIDDSLAWTFRKFNRGRFIMEVRDAQEFNPDLIPKFAAAKKKAEQQLAARGVKRQLGYVHGYWAELKKVLREEYQIRWRSPADLNAAIYD